MGRASRYTSSPPTGGAVSLRLGQARVLVPTGNQFNTAPLLRSPQGEAKEDVRGRVFNSPRFDLSALCGLYPILPLIPHAVVVSPPYSGGQGGIPLAALSFFSFSFSGERKTDRRRRSRVISVAKLPHSKQPIHNPRNRSTHNGAGRKIKFF